MSHESHGDEGRTLTKLINYLQKQASFSTFQNLGACSLDIATVLTFEGSAWTDVKIHPGTTQLGQPQERSPQSCGLEVRWGTLLPGQVMLSFLPRLPFSILSQKFPCVLALPRLGGLSHSLRELQMWARICSSECRAMVCFEWIVALEGESRAANVP